MDRANEMTALVCTVATGSFSAAARELNLTPSALSKLVSRLEERLGVRLFHRSTRRLHLTSEGEAFYSRARAILAAMDEAEAEVMDSASQPRGVLRLHCGLAFGIHRLTPVIPKFLERHPQIRLDLNLSDTSDEAPAAGNADLTIFIGALTDSSQVARRIRNVERVICAAPAYLEKHGTPQTPDDLLRHNCLWISSLPSLRRWPFNTDEGLRSVPVDGNVVANNSETVVRLALAGLGITRLTDILVGEAIHRGELVPILTDWHHAEPVPLYALYPGGGKLSPKVRAMVDFLVEEFGAN